MEIPDLLIEKVKQGKVVLFLGSGALYGATLPNKDIPFGNELRDILCDEYLGDSFKESELAHVAAMAISQSSLFDVQDHIKNYFAGLEPAGFHLQIPMYNWRAIFTTNYDLLVESCYRNADSIAQDLSVILSNDDQFDETRTTNEKLPYLKLHGCVTRTHDAALPLILTTDQYNDCLTNRRRLFSHLYELAYENTLVFIGHSLLDHNIRKVLQLLEKEVPHGQRHYLLKPGVHVIEQNFWGEKKISALDLTFEGFLNALGDSVSSSDRLLSSVRPPSEHPIQSLFNTHSVPSEELIEALTSSMEWISPDLSVAQCDPKKFFRGEDQTWSPIADRVCIHRRLQEDIFDEVIELPDAEKTVSTGFYVVKGEAGSGKSVLLRQLAWQAAGETDSVVLWVKEGCIADYYLVKEVIDKSGDNVFLFWDDAAINSIELSRFLLKARQENLRLTIITAERYNEWNVRCEDLDEIVTNKFELRYLSEDEIDRLILALDKFDSLGPNLISKTHRDRCIELRDIHGRQLLVALHEATMGEPFEDIIFNEYENIHPEAAKNIYLTICTLNRFRIPVRAGLMSRIHDISFTDFKERFHMPLEKVVITKGASDQDVHYAARHSEIAEIVFRRALCDVANRYQEYIDIINKLNISFSSDRLAFRGLIKAKSLSDLFPDYEDVASIYKHARDSIGDDSYLLQQMANYERIRPNGSLDSALELLVKAKDSAPYDSSIVHSLSVVWRDKAKKATDLHLRKKCRSEARGYLDLIVSRWGMSSYISSSMIELSIDALRDLLADDSVPSTIVRKAIRQVQTDITENKRQYPAETHLHILESDFARLIDDNERALVALEKSFEENDREPFLAIRLASNYVSKDNIDRAKEILQKALERRRADHRLNYHFAELLRKYTSSSMDEIMYYYRRGFTPNDRNHQAQFWYARYAYKSAEDQHYRMALEIFDGLRNARLSHTNKIEIRDYDGDEDSMEKFEGVITEKKNTYGFVKQDGRGDKIFFSEHQVEEGLWKAMIVGDRVCFNVGYSYKGVVACNVTC